MKVVAAAQRAFSHPTDAGNDQWEGREQVHHTAMVLPYLKRMLFVGLNKGVISDGEGNLLSKCQRPISFAMNSRLLVLLLFNSLPLLLLSGVP